ncbi:hypothetical protein K3495_g6883 [Podosphaera aphanis]|nr:hypothetical protein K3495_g6883 [Podosphaera aphanis]
MVPLIVSSPLPPIAIRPNKSILRRPAQSGTTRKVDDAGLDDDLPLLTSNKRLKVTFGTAITDKVIDEEPLPKTRALETIRAEVKRAIEAHLKGNSEAYDVIKYIFSPKKKDDDDEEEGEEENERPNNGEMKSYLLALTSCASLLGKGCSGLVKNVLSIDWLGREEAFVKAYIYFLGSLASTQGTYVESILEMLIEFFLGIRLSSGRLVGCPDVSREQLSSRVHAALRYLLGLIPSASSTLLPLVGKRYPFSDESKKIQITYINNLIQVTEYATELKPDIIALITDRLVRIDVQMQVDLDDLDDDIASGVVHAISSNSAFEKDRDEDEDYSDSDTDSVISNEDLSEDARRIKAIRDNVEKMDMMLDLLFTVYTPYFSDPNSIEAISMFETLLTHFANIILPAYRSRHTQFLLFHFAQKSEHLVDQFAGTCVQLAFHNGRPAILKQSAAAYLASFVARGARVQKKIVQTVFDLIGTNLDHIRAENELTCRGPDLKRYSTFYAMTQALLYIFCFRWRDLITSEILEDDDPFAFVNQDLNWTPGIKEILSRTIYSKLNPLKICSPSIVAEFAKIAHHLKFMYVYPLLETNKRIRLSQYSSINTHLRDAGNGGYNESWYQLDAYFPFDPYQLPVSKRWIEADYVQWKSLPGLNQEEDDESEEEEDLEIGDDDSSEEDR